jgi:N6-L-threonylcarbamoyladenine synthase
VKDGREVLSNVVYTQIPLHQPYGGVVPEVASRAHIEKIRQVVGDAMAGHAVDAVAVTYGPGLSPALIVGLNAAKGLAKALGVPLFGINHIEAHLHTPFLYDSGEAPSACLSPEDFCPALGLAVSGGNTVWIDMPEYGRYEVIGETLDDAAGEAFDKVSRMLGLGYPGGPIVERGAKGGNEKAFKFTRPHFKDGDPLDFSFSGLKTAVLTVLKKFGAPPEGQDLADLLASFQHAVCDQLVERTLEAAKHFGCKHAVLAGGVACNGALRRLMQETLSGEGIALHMPRPRWCTDNAAMIGAAAWHRDQVPGSRLTGEALRSLNAVGNWDIGENL